MRESHARRARLGVSVKMCPEKIRFYRNAVPTGRDGYVNLRIRRRRWSVATAAGTGACGRLLAPTPYSATTSASSVQTHACRRSAEPANRTEPALTCSPSETRPGSPSVLSSATWTRRAAVTVKNKNSNVYWRHRSWKKGGHSERATA